MKEDEFSQQEIQGLINNMEFSKDGYIYTNFHDIFFVEFPCLLYEWLKS
jgi:hypothetical protein